MHVAHIIAEKYIEVSCKEDTFANSQKIHSFRHIIVENTRQTCCCTARNVFQLSSDFGFNSFSNINEFLKFISSSLNGTVAAEICAYASENEVWHIVFHFNRDINHFILVPETFAKVTEIRHDDNFVLLTLPAGFFVQSFQDFDFTVKADIGNSYNLRNFAQHRNPQKKARKLDSEFLGIFKLFESGRSD